MALLDGKYEITNQITLTDKQSQFDAIAPDGETLRIDWFDLDSSEEEQKFERYRKVLRALKKQGLAALHDIVSRPGTHYVAWYTTKHSKDISLNEDIREILQEHQFENHMLFCSKNKQGQVQVYDLSFEASLSEKPALEPKADVANAPSEAFITVPSWLLSWLLCFSLLALASGFFLAGFLRQMNTQTVRIPELIGKDINEAIGILEGLKLRVSATAISSPEQAGTVLSLNPEQGSVLRPFYRNVAINYALPAEQFALKPVPQLRSSAYNAETLVRLERAGFRLGNVAFMHSNHPRGDIIAQSVVAETQLEENSKIDLLVSQGPQNKRSLLPELSGLALEDAIELVELAGLSPPDILYQASSRYPTGTVIDQSIPAYTEIILGKFETTLRLTVASGFQADAEGIPSLLGYSLEQANVLAPGYALEVKEIDTANLPAGIVHQTPAPNSPISTTSLTLLLNIYQPPLMIPLPAISSFVKEPVVRKVMYRFLIEQGIPLSQAEVYVNQNGEDILIAGRRVLGGDVIEGSWETSNLGSTTFKLKLNKSDYATLKVP